MLVNIPSFHVVLKSFNDPAESFVAQTENSVKVLHVSEWTSHDLRTRVIWEYIHYGFELWRGS